MATKTLKVDLPAEIFDARVSIPLIHQVVVAQQAAARQGTHATKTRGMVRGGGRKPYKQKGTGRARQGSTRAPQFTGGGTVHGPQPRSYDQRTPKKMKAAALRGALTDRARNERIHVVADLVSGDTPSTKAARSAIRSITDRRRVLVVLERADSVTWLSLRNLPEVHILAVDQLNTYDVMASDDVIFTQGAYAAFVGEEVAAVEAQPDEGKPAKAKPAKAAKSEDKPAKDKPAKSEDKPAEAVESDGSEATEAESEDQLEVAPFADIPGAAQPGPDGEAPEGYLIKGNMDSMKYHAPGGQWYDATVAEVWFKTAADAEAAGFVEAGSKASKKANEKAEKKAGEKAEKKAKKKAKEAGE